jgi:hypothetical protein
MFVYLGLKFTRELALRLCVVSEGGERLIAHAYEQPTSEERGSRHLRDETHVVELSLPFRAAQKRRLTMTCAVLEAA